MQGNNQMMKGDRVQRQTARERDDASMRSLEIAQMRILARKRPNEFRKIAAELFDLMVKI
jgi:hypothetical protein